MNWKVIPWGMLGGLLLVWVLAWLAPERGMALGWLNIPGVVLIFLVQGLVLPGEAVRKGFASLRLHLFCQVGIFLVFPVMTWVLLALLAADMDPALRIGLLFLSVLPTTVATAAANTSVAGGQVAGAIFNITLSNFLGIFIAPVVLSALLMISGGVSLDLGPILLKIFQMVVLPFAVGQMLRPFVLDHVGHFQRWGSRINHTVILFIVYLAFCLLILDLRGGELESGMLSQAAVAVAVLLVVSRLLAIPALRMLKTQEERKAAYFCVCQKSLATGLPMALAVFAAPELEGISSSAYVLPLILFHPAQLALDSLIAAVWGMRRSA